MMRTLTFFFLTIVWLNPVVLGAHVLPEWMFPLRDAVYEQKLTANQIVSLYNNTKTTARQNFSGADLNLLLSRCEYFMGRAYLYEERNNEARIHFAEGLKIAENAVQTAPSAEAWVLRAENLAHLCQVNSISYAMANGLSVESYAKNALSLNNRHATAQYVIASRWVYAPAPLHNHRKGIEMMTAIIQDGDMEKDDRFNVYSAIGYAYLQQKKYTEAKTWFQKSLEVYPTNKFVAGLLNGIK